MAEIVHPNYVCEISAETKLPVMNDKYFQDFSAYEKCKCINKLKLSLEILAKKEPAKYNAYFEIYKSRYLKSNCDEVFKNYIQTNAQDIYSSVTKEDKKRIESQSIKERNQRIYIGVASFIAVIGIIGIYSTRNR